MFRKTDEVLGWSIDPQNLKESMQDKGIPAKGEPARSASNQQGGLKFDGDKPDLALLPPYAKQAIARAFMDGEKKYGRYNYLKGMDWSRLQAAAERHLTAFNMGEDLAEDSKLHHLAHAGACIMMLLEYIHRGIGNDNRYKGG